MLFDEEKNQCEHNPYTDETHICYVDESILYEGSKNILFSLLRTIIIFFSN